MVPLREGPAVKRWRNCGEAGMDGAACPQLTTAVTGCSAGAERQGSTGTVYVPNARAQQLLC